MSVHAYAWAWQQPTATTTQKFVLLAMCEFADSTGLCWPSMQTLARMTGVHRATVARCIDELVTSGLLMRATGRGKSNTYRLQLTAPRLPSESRSSALWDESIDAKNVVAFPGVSHSATPQLSTGVAECDTYLSHSATPRGRRVSHGATGGVASGATGGVASDATRTVMNRYEPSARTHDAVDNSGDPDSWRRIPESARELASRQIAAIRAQMEQRAASLPVDGVGLVDTRTGEVLSRSESDGDACAPHGMARPQIAHERGA
jgi:hypothetical protein